MRPHTLLLCLGLLGCPAPDDDTAPGAGDTEDLTPVEPVVERDLAYPPPEGGDPAMSTLDLYRLPDGQPQRLLVFVHGGSWVGGDKSNLDKAPQLVSWYLERGFVLAAPNFRLASPLGQELESSYAEQCADLAAALAWLVDSGEAYGVTEPGITLMGYSSGAHLVALLGADQRYLEAAGLTGEALSAVMSLDVHAYDVPYALELMVGSEVEQNIPLIEHLFGASEEEQRVGSPSSYVATAAIPRSLVVSAEPSKEEGGHGWITSLTGSAWAELLAINGHEAQWQHFDDESHSSLVLDFGLEGDGPTALVESFLE
jgi:arylformamidase